MITRRNVLFLSLIAAFGTAIWFVGCSAPDDPWGGKPTPHILVSVPPLYSFAKSVAGDHGEVKCLCTTTGPHQFVASPTDTRLLRGATVFFSVGLGLDDKFCDSMAEATEKKSLLVKVGADLPADLRHDFADEPGTPDPHVWNGTAQAIKMVEQIRDQLKKIDSAHAAEYDKNADDYIKKLKKLHDDGISLLKDKKDKKIVSFHDSLSYFAKEFGIEIVDVVEDIPGTESNRSKIRKLVNECIEKNVLVIAVEPQYPTSTAAKLIQEEVEAATKSTKEGTKKITMVEIDPLETADAKDLSADLYTKTMRKNLQALADNLK